MKKIFKYYREDYKNLVNNADKSNLTEDELKLVDDINSDFPFIRIDHYRLITKLTGISLDELIGEDEIDGIDKSNIEDPAILDFVNKIESFFGEMINQQFIAEGRYPEEK